MLGRPRRRLLLEHSSIGACFLILLVASSLSSPALAVSEEDQWLPTNPLRGRIVFEEKYCIKCHAISGAGGEIGPDLSEAYFYGSFLDLASILWNHIPDMVVEYKNLNLRWPSFSDEEVSSLISYLYYLRYLGEPGSVSNGKKLLEKKGCLYCHSIGGGGNGGEVGPPLDKLKRYASPIYMVQAIWNHGPRMQEKMDEMGIERPKFDGQEISDLSAYIRAVSQWAKRERVYLSPGNPKDGKKVFEEKGCYNCHSVYKRGGKVGPSLDEIDLNKSVTEIAGMMWNHAEVMWTTMKHEEITWPTFTGREMADLIAYLYFIKFVDPPGSIERGKLLFSEKQCLSCHSIRGVGAKTGPDLSRVSSLVSSISILRTMINHSAKMSETALKVGKMWPKLSGQEMRDIFAYLKWVHKEKDQ